MQPLKQLLRDPSVVPAFATFRVSAGYALPAGFNPGKIRGLVFCEVRRTIQGDATLETYWKSLNFLASHKAEFRRATFAGDVLAEGEIGETKGETDPWWRRLLPLPRSPSELLTNLPALVGWVTILGGAYLFFFAAPEVTLDMTTRSLDAAADVPFAIPLTMTNTSRLTSAQVTITKASLSDGVVEQSGDIFTVEAGKRSEFSLHAHVSRPGKAQLVIDADVHGGYLRRARARRAIGVVEVWPTLARSAFQADARECAGTSCLVRAELRFGRDAGPYSCSAYMVDADDVDFRAVRTAPNGGEPPIRSHGSGASTIKIQWRTLPAQRFTTQRVEIVMGGRSRSGSEWESLARRINWDCSPPQSGG